MKQRYRNIFYLVSHNHKNILKILVIQIINKCTDALQNLQNNLLDVFAKYHF